MLKLSTVGGAISAAASPACSNCRHFVADAKVCRRYPPTVVVLVQHSKHGPMMVPATLHPAVKPDAICGEHAV